MLAAVGSLAFAACGGSDDVSDAIDSIGSAPANDVSDDGAAADQESDAATSDSSGAGFGEFISGTIAFSGGEDETYAIDDPASAFTGSGGCGGGQFGFSINAVAPDTGYTLFQLSAGMDEDLSGGATGTYDVDEVALLVVPDGDLSASRRYEGPGTIAVTEHDTGGIDSDLNSRRMAITLEGTLDAMGSDADGTVDVSADVLWVMGCP